MQVGRNGSGEARDAGIPGRADELADVAVGGESGDERVLARAAADDENSHCLNDLWRVTAIRTVRGRMGTISLTLTVICA